ncbi:MAG: FHA domain-containing protein [Anaerolineales bacterium]
MDLSATNSLLFAGKWVFVGLIYFVLLVVLVAVRREMGLRLRAGQALPSTAAGRLLLLQGGSPAAPTGTVWPLNPNNTLGAETGNDLVLPDPLISGRHARLRWDGVGWWLEDLGSTNGTLVNGQRLAARAPQKIAPGARLQLGDMVFELRE